MSNSLLIIFYLYSLDEVERRVVHHHYFMSRSVLDLRIDSYLSKLDQIFRLFLDLSTK